MQDDLAEICAYVRRHQHFGNYSEQTGCSLLLDTGLVAKAKGLEESPFKFYLLVSNGVLGDVRPVEDYLEEYYPSLTPETRLLSMVFYINYRHMTQALGGLDRQQLRSTGRSILREASALPAGGLVSIVARFYASLVLCEYVEHIDDALSAQKQCMQLMEDNYRQLELSPLYTEANMISYPPDLVKLLYAKNLIRNQQIELAVPLFKSLQGLTLETAELLYQINPRNVAEAVRLLSHEMADLGQDTVEKLVNHFEVKEADLRTTDFSQFDCKQLLFHPGLARHAQRLTILGELLDNQHLLLLAAAADPRNARAYRDLGCCCMGKFRQERLDQAAQLRVVGNAQHFLAVAHRLEPGNRVCRENLAALLILTRQSAGVARQLYQSLIADFGEQRAYLRNVAATYQIEGNLRAALDYYVRADRCGCEPDVELALQVLRLLVEVDAQEGRLDQEKTVYMLGRQLNAFYAWRAAAAAGGDVPLIFVQNFLYQAHEPVTTLLNRLVSIGQEQNATGILEQARRLLGRWLECVCEYCATQAGDEVIGAYLQIKKRLE